jgi:hypothetical protein
MHRRRRLGKKNRCLTSRVASSHHNDFFGVAQLCLHMRRDLRAEFLGLRDEPVRLSEN